METERPPSEAVAVDGETEPLSYRIAERIAAAADTSPLALAPLHEYVDVDAIETLVADGNPQTTVSFVYEEFLVRVRGNGTVTVVPASADERPQTGSRNRDVAGRRGGDVA
jgi:hypothetical protein